MSLCFVYEIRNVVDGMRYIGKTIDPKGRWSSHKYDALRRPIRRGCRRMRVHRAIRKHGVEAFEFRVLAELQSEEAAYELERLLIASLDKAALYNTAEGGSSGRTLPPSERKRLNERTNKARSPTPVLQEQIKHLYFDCHCTAPEIVEKLNVTRGQVRGLVNRIRAGMAQEDRDRLKHEHGSAVRSGPRNSRYGAVVSTETRAKMRLTQLRRSSSG